MGKKLFVTGTGTDVGKTFVSGLIVKALHDAGLSCGYYKAAMSGNVYDNNGTLVPGDAKFVKNMSGMYVCSGGIIGMGETWEDRIDMAVSLAEAGADSIPTNALMPIKGTPLYGTKQLTNDEILRTIALFRYINPKAEIRLAAGRALLENDGEFAFQSGASATITGNMLTTAACATIRSDREMLEKLGRTLD